MPLENTQDTPGMETKNSKPTPDDSRDLSPPPNSHPNGVFSSISASASSLLSSITNPSASSVTGSLASSSNLASTKSVNQRYPPPSASGHPSTPSDGLTSTSPSSLHNSTSETQGFRSQQFNQLHSPEGEFSSFTKRAPTQLYTSEPSHAIPSISGCNYNQGLVPDGQDVISLLSQSLTSAIYLPGPELEGINIAHPVIRSFAVCDDPIEFLSTTGVYTEEVWGGALQVVREAREELLGDKKGKRKQDTRGTATERLKMIWGHLKGTSM